MDIPQKIALYTAVACLLLVLLRFQVNRFNKARTRNTVSIAIDCDVAEAREGIRQLTADVERLQAHVQAVHRDLTALKADESLKGLVARITKENRHPLAQDGRDVIGLPVRRQQPPRKSPPAPPPMQDERFGGPAKKTVQRKPR